MGSKKDPNQKGSGAKKHRRNYRIHHDGKFAVMGTQSKYRLRHGIPAGSRKANHASDNCPLHRRV